VTAADIEAKFAEAVDTVTPRLYLLHLVAVLDDGRVYEATADQRDMRRALVALGTQDPETDKLGFPRACAWAYLTRHGLIDLGWADFDRQAAQVMPPDDEQVLEAVDPTGPGPAG
jgi:hypothetical protein